MRKSRNVLTIIFSITVLGVYSLKANIAKSPLEKQGNIIGTFQMKNVTVLHENLKIEVLRIPDNKNGDIRVTAIYKLKCPNFIEPLDLIFIANDLNSTQYLLTLDGKFITGSHIDIDNLPSSWLPPVYIQGENEKIPYHYYTKGLISFKLDSLSEGEHTLIVSYMANTAYYYSENNEYKSLVYILKPDTGWKDFDSLDLSVEIPANYNYTSNIKLEKQAGNNLHGLWPKLPATYLSIALSKSMVMLKIVSCLAIFSSSALLIFLSCFLLYRLAKARILKNGSSSLQKISCIILSIFSFTLFPYLVISLNTWITITVNGGDISPFSEIGREYVYMMVFGFPFLLIFSLLITFGINALITMLVRNKINKSTGR